MVCRLLRKVCLNWTKWWWLSKYKLQYAAWSSTLVLIKYFIHQMAKIFISIIWHAKKYNFNEFLSSWNPGIGMPSIPVFEIGKNDRDQLHIIFPLLLCEVYCWVNIRWNINHKIMPVMLFRWFYCCSILKTIFLAKCSSYTCKLPVNKMLVTIGPTGPYLSFFIACFYCFLISNKRYEDSRYTRLK